MKQPINHKDIRDAVITSQHCQRNFDLTREMPQEDIDTILYATTQCPSKQNLAFHNIVAIQDRETIEAIHAVTRDRKGVRTNPQVLGNLLLVFTERDPNSNFLEEDGTVKVDPKTGKPLIRNLEMREISQGENAAYAARCLESDSNIALGIAAGYCNLVASQLGYRTGCSSCFQPKEVAKVLRSRGISEKPLLLMGIGYHDTQRNRRAHHVTNKMIETNVKIPIKVDWI